MERLPQTRLGKVAACNTYSDILEHCDGYDPELNEFKFLRQPRNFNSILSFLRTGMLHLGEETCVIAFSQVSLRRQKSHLISCPRKNCKPITCLNDVLSSCLDFPILVISRQPNR